MTVSKSLPARPSLESLRKQAKKLVRDSAAGDASAGARARAQLPNVELPLTQRTAQLVIAREYGFAGWQDLTAEVHRRLGNALDWAATRARRAIHDNDIDGLKRLVAEHPALLSWQGGDRQGGLLGFATGSFGDSFDPESERHFTRAECAELLIDAGALVNPSVCDGILESRARGLLQLFRRKGLLPDTLKFLAALGDLDAVRAALAKDGNDAPAVTDAFISACAFEHAAVASLLLERLVGLDPELGTHVEGDQGRAAFISSYIELRPAHAQRVGPWKALSMARVKAAIVNQDLTAFVRTLQQQPWLLGDACAWFQAELIGTATLNDRENFITTLLALDPAILRHQPPPPSQAIEFALTYAHAHLIPLLTRIWPLPDDLPHAAGVGDFSRVTRWFDTAGVPALGDLARHYPYNDARARAHLLWDVPSQQQILDTAFAWSVINAHFEIADYLLERGADINTNWSSHEPASILHELVFHGNYDSMRFLIDRGIDMTIKDYRWNSTAKGWARYAAKDAKMAEWLETAERQRLARSLL